MVMKMRYLLSKPLMILTKKCKKETDLLGIKGNTDSKVGNGLSDVILNNIHLSPEQIDELCEDYRGGSFGAAQNRL